MAQKIVVEVYKQGSDKERQLLASFEVACGSNSNTDTNVTWELTNWVNFPCSNNTLLQIAFLGEQMMKCTMSESCAFVASITELAREEYPEIAELGKEYDEKAYGTREQLARAINSEIQREKDRELQRQINLLAAQFGVSTGKIAEMADSMW